MSLILECQLFSKAKKLIKRKIRNFASFQNALLNEEFIDAICAIDDLEESFEDILIFDISPNYRHYEESLIGEISDLEELKSEVINNVELLISDYHELDADISFAVFEEMIDKWECFYCVKIFTNCY